MTKKDFWLKWSNLDMDRYKDLFMIDLNKVISKVIKDKGLVKFEIEPGVFSEPTPDY